ncbi:MAG: peptide ABC transporter substrate-binding protein [Clostridiales bacterium]|nr:peptide ABC transporter substrate-binding protein [Clostridiales bacterium]
MKKWISLLLCAMMLMSSVCAVAEDEVTYTTLYSSEVTTLNYLVTSSTNEFAIAANIIDTLVEYDMYGRMQPSLALEWESSNEGLTWTFKLRQDATWVDGDGKVVANVTANDFVAAAKYILNAKNASATADILYDVIEGAKVYYDATAILIEGVDPAAVLDWNTVGIKAVDDYTLQYTLSKPVPYFLSMLTYVNFMPVYEPFLTAQGENFGLATGNDTLLYCGAFYLDEFKSQESRVLAKNHENWDADNVHIDKIIEKCNKESTAVSPTMFLNGEVDAASLKTELVEDWLMDEEKAAKIHPARITTYYSYFYTFNFDPKFDAAYEPDNWKVAVNNENFRKSIVNAFNRIKTKTLVDAENPESMIFNTITPPTFVYDNGVDFVNLGSLAEITAKGADMMDLDAALQYKDAAMKELEGKATFPVKILWLYNPSTSANNSAEEAQIVEQQLEGVLGTDYIDIIIESGPATSYNTARRTGMYAMMNCNWGPDYADPETFTDPFVREGNSYSFIGESTDTECIEGYYALVENAKAITDDISARYLAFAEAEAYLINHAYVLPYGHGVGGYTASLLDPFSAPVAPFGLTTERYKGQYKLDDYMDTDAFYDAWDAYEAAKEEALSQN